MIQQRIHAGLKRARAQGKTLGRPKVDQELETAIKRLLKKGTGTKAIVRETGASPSVIVRLKRELGIEVQPWTRQAEGAAE
jgi:DNA invertase Pin-like site-specific DNA recombinase